MSKDRQNQCETVDRNRGSEMNNFIALMLVFATVFFGVTAYQEAKVAIIRAEAQAQAVVIRAEREASIAKMDAALPIVISVSAGVVGLAFGIGLITFAVKRKPKVIEHEKIIERQIVYILPPHTPRREIWQALADNKSNVKLLQPGEKIERKPLK